MSFTAGIVYSLMCLVGMALGTETLLGRDLRLLLGFAIIPSIFALLVLLPMPETPKYLLLSKKDRERSMQSLQLFHGKSSAADLDLQLKSIEKEVENGGDDEMVTTSIREIFTTPHLRRAVVFSCLGISFDFSNIQTIGVFAALQLTIPQWPVFLLSTTFLHRVHLSDRLAEMSSTLVMLAYAIASIFGYLMVERYSRRALLLGFSCINQLCLLLFTLFAAFEPIIGLMRYGCLISLIVFGFTFG